MTVASTRIVAFITDILKTANPRVRKACMNADSTLVIVGLVVKKEHCTDLLSNTYDVLTYALPWLKLLYESDFR